MVVTAFVHTQLSDRRCDEVDTCDRIPTQQQSISVASAFLLKILCIIPYQATFFVFFAKKYLFFQKQSATLILLQQQQSQKPALTVESATLALAPINKGDKLIMTKRQCFKPWGVARLLPTGKWVIIGRYHNASDADGHLQLLHQRVPHMQFKVVFDLPNRQK